MDGAKDGKLILYKSWLIWGKTTGQFLQSRPWTSGWKERKSKQQAAWLIVRPPLDVFWVLCYFPDREWPAFLLGCYNIPWSRPDFNQGDHRSRSSLGSQIILKYELNHEHSWLEPGFPCKCMLLYKLVTLLKFCKYSFYDLTIPNIDIFPCMFAYFGLLRSTFKHNAYFEDF